MTPKEKAKEIYCKYANALNIRDLQATANPFVKQCAIIAVDLVIDTNPYSTSLFNFFPKLDYWHRVREEIDKI
jgi:hypothetical protein